MPSTSSFGPYQVTTLATIKADIDQATTLASTSVMLMLNCPGNYPGNYFVDILLRVLVTTETGWAR